MCDYIKTKRKSVMTVSELIDVLNGFDQNAIVMRESIDMACDYKLESVVTYGTDFEHIFLKFDDFCSFAERKKE